MTSASAEPQSFSSDSTSSESALQQAVAAEARLGLLAAPRTLAPWLFYDDLGSRLFEEITVLPEYYLTRTERELFQAHAEEILFTAGEGRLTLVELGAGTATKTGILLRAAVRRQGGVLYQPIDVSETALAEAEETLAARIPGVVVVPQVANYITDLITIRRPDPATGILALYIGSSIGNFSPEQASGILANLRSQLAPGDSLLLGTDLAPGPNKSVATLLAAYDDAAGVTASFNRNILTRLNRDLGADFEPTCFAHRARWNAALSRIEMHLESLTRQQVKIPANSAGPALTLSLNPGETIHTENSYKFTPSSIAALLSTASFATTRTWQDPSGLFAVTLATAT